MIKLAWILGCFLFIGELMLQTLVASEFTMAIVDATTLEPLAARVYVQNMTTKSRHFARSLSKSDAVIYERQNWINKQSIEHHTSVPAAAFIVENLEAGTYEVTVEKGKEYLPETRVISLIEGESRSAETVPLRRWINMAKLGWYSGETHLHRNLNELPVVLLAEDLNVAMPLTYWVTKAFTPPTSGNKNQAGEIPDRLIEVDPTHVIWPRNTEYEIFSVGEQNHTLGALFVLNHRQVLDRGVPDWKPIAKTALEDGALLDMDKLDWPFAMTLPPMTGATIYELANNHMWRTEFAFTKWNTEAPAFLQPPFGGKEGNEFDWLNYTLGQYYVLLNAGFRMIPSAGTASGVHPVPAGFSRVYVHLERFTYENWLKGFQSGKSFVTTGPMIFAKLNNEFPGAKISNRATSVSAEILSEHPLKQVELVVNGRIHPISSSHVTKTERGAYRVVVESSHRCDSSGWICLRCQEDRPDGRLRFAHTAPWWIEIPGLPLRISEIEKNYLIHRVEQELARSTNVLPESALEEYRQALRYYKSLLTE